MIKVQSEVFPARIVCGEEMLESVKAIISLDRVWACRIQGRDGEILREWRISDLRGDAQHGYEADADGKRMSITRGGGCGCGANKSWRPFQYQISMSKIPSL